MTGRRRGQGSPATLSSVGNCPSPPGLLQRPRQHQMSARFPRGQESSPSGGGGMASSHSPPPLAGPLGKEGGRRKTAPLQISEHNCLVRQSVRLPRRVRSPGFTAETHDD